MESPEGYAANALELVQRLVELALARLHFFVHHAGGTRERSGIADEKPEVYVYGRMLRGSPNREVAKLHGAQVPERLRQP
jgi:hypothetical protein